MGYVFGYGNTNTAYRFTGLQEGFAFGLGETGDLIPRAVDAAKAGVAKAKEAASKGLEMGKEVAAKVVTKGNRAVDVFHVQGPGGGPVPPSQRDEVLAALLRAAEG